MNKAEERYEEIIDIRKNNPIVTVTDSVEVGNYLIRLYEKRREERAGGAGTRV